MRGSKTRVWCGVWYASGGGVVCDYPRDAYVVSIVYPGGDLSAETSSRNTREHAGICTRSHSMTLVIA